MADLGNDTLQALLKRIDADLSKFTYAKGKVLVPESLDDALKNVLSFSEPDRKLVLSYVDDLARRIGKSRVDSEDFFKLVREGARGNIPDNIKDFIDKAPALTLTSAAGSTLGSALTWVNDSLKWLWGKAGEGWDKGMQIGGVNLMAAFGLGAAAAYYMYGFVAQLIPEVPFLSSIANPIIALMGAGAIGMWVFEGIRGQYKGGTTVASAELTGDPDKGPKKGAALSPALSRDGTAIGAKASLEPEVGTAVLAPTKLSSLLVGTGTRFPVDMKPVGIQSQAAPFDASKWTAENIMRG